MTRGFLVPLLLLTALVPPGQPQSTPLLKPAFKRELLTGYWKWNWKRSKLDTKMAGTPLPTMYRRYEDQGNGLMLHTVIIVAPDQNAAQLLSVAVVKYDDREYPVYSGRMLADRLTSGKQPARTVAFHVVDDHSLNWTDRTDGKITGTGTVVLSPDGTILTDTNRVFDAAGRQTSVDILLYEKH
jgi:hypothetical protein